MKRAEPPPCVLTIAGSDSGGGAGVQADARTIHALGGFACMAITALTAQNTRAVQQWRAESPQMIAAQLAAVLGPFDQRAHSGDAQSSGVLPVRAIKTGLLPGGAAIRAVARALRVYRDIPLVVDPVIGSTSGARFLDTSGIKVLCRELLPRATLVTPNWPEAEALSGRRVRNFAEAERAARLIATQHDCAVLLKGGHAPGAKCRDCLVTANGKLRWFTGPRVKTHNAHGTGCVLSAAIATELAQGKALPRAVASARAFLQRSLRHHCAVGWGGAGPAFPG